MAPDQKATTTPESKLENPSNQPNPKASLASPRPIQVPLEISHKNAKGSAKNTPDKNSKIVGICGKNKKLAKKNKPIKAITPKTKESISGIILCLKS